MFKPLGISLHVSTQTFDTNHFMSSHTTYLSNLVAVCQITNRTNGTFTLKEIYHHQA